MSTYRVHFKPSSSKSKILHEPLPKPSGLIESNVVDRVDGETVSAEINRENEIKNMNSHCMKIAFQPGPGILQTAFFLYMSGNSIQIFSIYALSNALFNPLKGMTSVNSVFKKFDKEEGVNTTLPKLLFVALQFVALGVALYKCKTMGLLPLTSMDWLWRLPEREMIETVTRPII